MPILLKCPNSSAKGFANIDTSSWMTINATNLNDSGSGSLRDILENYTGGRIIKFPGLSGDIVLKSGIQPVDGNFYIRGDTAANGGICLRWADWVQVTAPTNTLILLNHSNIIIEHVRFRPGVLGAIPNIKAQTKNFANGFWQTNPFTVSPANGGQAENIYFKNCSFSFYNDDAGAWGGSNISFYRCLWTWPLTYSTHPDCYSGSSGNWTQDTPHGMGQLFGFGVRNFTMYQCVTAFANARGPLLSDCGDAEFVNNIWFDLTNTCLTCHLQGQGKTPPSRNINMIGNWYIRGPGSNSSTNSASYYVVYGFDPAYNIYLNNNFCNKRNLPSQANSKAIHPSNTATISVSKHKLSSLVEYSPQAMYDLVLANAGAILPKRDAIDTLAITHIKNRTGSKINDPAEIGGWPDLSK